MTINELNQLVRSIVNQAQQLNNKHTSEHNPPVNYACIFAQSNLEYDQLIALISPLGQVADQTAMGPVFRISPISTVAGDLSLLKIRKPDSKRLERGDADFTVADYAAFKGTHLSKPGFSLIERQEMEMMELIDPDFSVLAYYSHPILADVIAARVGKANSES